MMKKLLFAAIVLLVAFTHKAWAYDHSEVCSSGQTLYYNINGTSAIVVTPSPYNSWDGFTEPSGELVIPSSVTYNGDTYIVDSIAAYAFVLCHELTSVTIPNSVTGIGERAFINCSGLTSVTIGNSVTSIGNYAFYECSGLTGDLTIPNSVTSIGELAFASCEGLTSITIPNSITIIGDGTFSYCSGLTSVIIPNSVTSIGRYAFQNCSGLTSVAIPNSVTTIGECAFQNCSGLSDMTIGNSVTTIDEHAFQNCSGLTSVTIGEGVASIGGGAFSGCSGLTTVNYNAANCTTMSNNDVWYDCTSLATLNIGENVTNIPVYAFYGCIGLTSVTIPNSVTSIGREAFYGCSGLTSVTIGNSVTSIGNYAFYDCSGLAEVTIPNSVTSIGSCAFRNCSGLTTLTYNAANCTFNNNNNVWDGCSSLATLNIGENVTNIPNSAFYGCSSLTSVNIGNGVTSIDAYAFYNCTGLASIEIPDAVTSIGNWAFAGCSNLDTLVIGSGLTAINASHFSNDTIIYLSYNCPANNISVLCTNKLETVVIGDAVQTIPDNTFYGRTGLTSVTIGNGVTNIGEQAFRYCSGLTALTIPNSVASIGNDAFAECSGLTSVTIGNSVESIGNYAFGGCDGLTETHYAGTVEQWLAINIQDVWSNPIYISRNLYLGDSLVTRLQIPEGVTNINDNFQNDTALSYIYIPSTVTNISAYAFNGCAPSWFIFKPAVPPTLASSAAFLYTQNDHTYGSWMMVPWRSLDDYKTATNYTTFAANLIYPDSCQLTVNVNDPNLGTVTLDGSSTLTKVYQLLDIATVTVAPIEHYHQMVQIDGCTNINQEETEVTTYQLRFNRNVAYPTVQVNFVPDTLHVGVAVNNELFGTVSGEGDYAYGDMVTVEATPADGYYFVRWADGSTENPATFVCAGDTTVTAIFSNDVTPELCMVSVQNNRNVLLWNTENLPITSYTIYREGNVSGEYEAVATIPYAEAGMFNDTASRPATRSYRYHLTATDTCGNESDHGETHKTMHLTISQGIGTTWNLVWTEYEGAEYTTYVIYRGTDASNIQQIDIMPSGGNTTYSDVNAPEGTVYYQVGVMMTTPCNTNRAATISRSNIATNGTIDNPPCELTGEETATACGNYEWRGTTYNESGNYEVREHLLNGCDSIITLHLTINQPLTELVEVTTCGSYEWNDSVYTESGDYTETYTAANGCDSVVTLHLTINQPLTELVEITACDSYEWNDSVYTESGEYTGTFTATNGCDSVVTLHLTINYSVQYSFSESAESPYIWNETEYTETGEYTQTFTAANGCDSVVTLHLNILTGISAPELAEINLYPNPVNDILNIVSSETISEIEIVNVMGQVVKRVEVNADNAACNVEDLVSGVYVIRIRTIQQTNEAAFFQRKFVKE
ncbi:MAG: leucine-rich repeat domain-containing protein [Bacteroidales bacterium]|nr:leucine-rich repeat domain-containing protein [Bacteroidales bacterium]